MTPNREKGAKDYQFCCVDCMHTRTQGNARARRGIKGSRCVPLTAAWKIERPGEEVTKDCQFYSVYTYADTDTGHEREERM